MNRKIDLECPECDTGTLERKIVPLTGTVRGESFILNSEAMVCSSCMFKTVPKEKMGEFALRIADAYREQHHLLTSSEIKDRRANLKMTQQQFANYLGKVGVASVRRWELGQIQDEAMNSLMVLKTDLRAARDNVVEVSARLDKPLGFCNVAKSSRLELGIISSVAVIWEATDRPGFATTHTGTPKALITPVRVAHESGEDLVGAIPTAFVA